MKINKLIDKIIKEEMTKIKESDATQNNFFEKLSELAQENPKEAKRIWKSMNPDGKKAFKKHMEVTDAANEGNYEGFLYLIGEK